MSTSTLPWLDLSSYQLMAQLSVDRSGNQALLIRSSDLNEPAQKSAKRAELMQTKFEGITTKVGAQTFRSRVLRGQINVLTGQMIRNPGAMKQFLDKMFPRAQEIQVTVDQMQQVEAIREAAKQIKANEELLPDGPLSLEALNQATPEGIRFDHREGYLITYISDNQPSWEPIPDDITNQGALNHVQDSLNRYLDIRKTDRMDALHQRTGELKEILGNENVPFWTTRIVQWELDTLNQWISDNQNALNNLVDQSPDTLDDQIELRDALIQHKEHLGSVIDDSLSQRLAQLEQDIERFQAGGSETGLDNVQQNEGSDAGVEGSVGGTEPDNVQEKGLVDGYRAIGPNLNGDTVYEDARGVRSLISGDFRVKESVGIVPTRGGVQARVDVDNRSLDYLSVAEALESPASKVSFEMKIRVLFEQTQTDHIASNWRAITVSHEGQKQPALVRSLDGKDRGALQILSLRASKLTQDAQPTINAQIMVLSPGNRLKNSGLASEAGENVKKLWTDLGLSLPQTPTSADLPRQNADTVGSDQSTEGQDNGRDTERRSDQPDSGSTGTTGAADGTDRAGDRDRDAGVSVGDENRGPGGAIPDSVGDRDESGVTDAGLNGSERGDPQSGDESAGDQQGSTVHAPEDLRRSGGSGTGVDAGSQGTGTDAERGTENDATATDDSGEQRGGTGAGGVSGNDAGGISPQVADDTTVQGGGERDRTEPPEVSDDAGTGSGGAGTSTTGTTDHSADPDGRGIESSATEDGAGNPPATDAGLEATADGSQGTSEQTDRDGGSGVDQPDDWERFAQQQAAHVADHTERYAGNPELEERGPAQRLKDNLNAITRLRQLEAAGETPSPEEREELGQFSGFGGIHSKLFGGTYNAPEFVEKGMDSMREMLRDQTLTTKEYESLRSTILNAHYTHSGIIGPTWEALAKMNVPMSRVLEPSCGTLNFKSFMPESVADKVGKFTAVELDPITASIAQAVHPDAHVINAGLEKTAFPDGFFDMAISNIPFGNYNVFDPEQPQRKLSIHNAFFLKALDKVRPGGVIAFVTSSYVMDSTETRVRAEMMERAHVAGAYRLPTGTFKESTGTEVVTDLVILQKKGNFTPNYTPLDILNTGKVEAPLNAGSGMHHYGKDYDPGEMVPGMKINQLYVDQPDRLLGELAVTTGPYGPELRLLGGGSIEEQRNTLTEALKSLPSNVPVDVLDAPGAASLHRMNEQHSKEKSPVSDLPGSLSIENGRIHVMVLQDDGTVEREVAPMPKTKALVNRGIAATEVMLSVSDLLDSETVSNADADELERKRTSVRELMDGWEKLEKGKKPLPRKIQALIQGDPRSRKVNVLNMINEDGSIERPDIAFQRTVQPITEAPTKADNVEDALAISLAYTGVVSETYMAELLKEQSGAVTPEAVRKKLVDQGLAFIDPLNQELVERSVYLSGNLRPKIEVVKNIVASDGSFEKNLEALEAALPDPLTPSQIKVSLDAFWLPEDVINQFLEEGMGLQTVGNFGIKAKFDEHQRYWRLEPSSTRAKPSMPRIAEQQSHVTKSRFGTERRDALELLANAFTNTIPKVQDKIPGSEPPKYVINAQETLKAQSKYDEIVDAFDRWVFKDPKRAQRLTDIYNEGFNTTVLYDPDGSHMVFPGMSDSYIPRKHQVDYIWRSVSGKNAMSAHCVGAGKTLELIGSAIRGKQMGRWSKPMVVVPNHMLDQFANDANDIYPNAKVLVMTASDGRAANRAAFAAKCAMGDWDLVICTHSVFEKITVPQEFEARIIDAELQKLRASLDNSEKQKRPKEVEKAIKRMEEQLERTMDNINNNHENILNMGEIGIDFIAIDEAHYFKNLMVDTSVQIPGVSGASSKRAMSMLIRCQYLNELHDGPYGVMMATGTPISNSVTELYTFTRMLRPDLLAEMGIANFNDWMGLFGEVKHGMEIKPEGGGYHMKSRLSRFKNIPELVKMVRTFIDFKTREDLNLPSPDIEHTQVVAPQSEFMKGFMKYIEARARTVRNKGNDEGGLSAAELIASEIRSTLYKANDKSVIDEATGDIDPDAIDMPEFDILLTIATDGRKASLDPRLIHPKFPDDPESKVNKAIDRLVTRYNQFDEQKAAQMIFCDFSSPTGKGIFNVYDDMKAKLIKHGVPESEIGFIHDAKTDADKEDLFSRVRSGEVRFLFGSTQKMGVGTNVQERLVGMEQMDPPWKPADVEQRLGRMERQGNSFDKAYNDTLTSEDSFDLFMWETLNRKLKMISQAMRSPEDCAREIDEETEPGYEDILAVTTGNPAIRDFMDARVKLDKLKRMQDSHIDQQADLGARIEMQSRKIESIQQYLENKLEEKALVEKNTPLALEVDGAMPGLCDGPMAVTGGLKNLGHALKVLAGQAKSYRTSTIGTFGGMTLKMSRMSSEPTMIVERLDGRDDSLYKIDSEQDDMLEESEQKDDYVEAARVLVRYVRKIGRDNGIEGTREALTTAKGNLGRLEEDLGKPFAYEQEIKDVRDTFQRLSEELGDEIDDKKVLDPEPLAAFAEAIHKSTGEHAGLAGLAREMADAEKHGQLNEAMEERLKSGLLRLHDDEDENDDEDLDEKIA